MYEERAIRIVLRGWAESLVTDTDPTMRAAAARASQVRLTGPFAYWDWDLINGQIRWTREMYRLLGVDCRVPAGFEAWFEVAVEEDLPAAIAALQHSILTGQPLATVWRIQRNGHKVWIGSVARAEVNRNGMTTRLCGSCLELNKRVAFPHLDHPDFAPLTGTTGEMPVELFKATPCPLISREK